MGYAGKETVLLHLWVSFACTGTWVLNAVTALSLSNSWSMEDYHTWDKWGRSLQPLEGRQRCPVPWYILDLFLLETRGLNVHHCRSRQ